MRPGEDAHRLLGPNMLFGYSVGASLVEEDEEEDDDDDEEEDIDDDVEDDDGPAGVDGL